MTAESETMTNNTRRVWANGKKYLLIISGPLFHLPLAYFITSTTS